MSWASTIFLFSFVIAVSATIHQDGGSSINYKTEDGHGNYEFKYAIADPLGATNSREEVGDAYGNKRGSYTLTDIDGRARRVDYVADEYGFRVLVNTNEPGTVSSNPADAVISSPHFGPEYVNPVIQTQSVAPLVHPVSTQHSPVVVHASPDVYEKPLVYVAPVVHEASIAIDATVPASRGNTLPRISHATRLYRSNPVLVARPNAVYGRVSHSTRLVPSLRSASAFPVHRRRVLLSTSDAASPISHSRIVFAQPANPVAPVVNILKPAATTRLSHSVPLSIPLRKNSPIRRVSLAQAVHSY